MTDMLRVAVRNILVFAYNISLCAINVVCFAETRHEHVIPLDKEWPKWCIIEHMIYHLYI